MTIRVEDCLSSSLRVSIGERETFPIPLIYYLCIHFIHLHVGFIPGSKCSYVRLVCHLSSVCACMCNVKGPPFQEVVPKVM